MIKSNNIWTVCGAGRGGAAAAAAGQVWQEETFNPTHSVRYCSAYCQSTRLIDECIVFFTFLLGPSATPWIKNTSQKKSLFCVMCFVSLRLSFWLSFLPLYFSFILICKPCLIFLHCLIFCNG